MHTIKTCLTIKSITAVTLTLKLNVMKKISLSLCCLFAAIVSFSQDITGAWYGALKVQGTQMRLVFNINKSETGYSATMDSPDQGVKGIKVSAVTFENGRLKIEVSMAKIEYIGELNNNEIVGNFKQGSMALPMNLSKEKIEKKVTVRPQEPSKPYPYYSEEITFDNKKANISLAGTLTLPKKEGSNYQVVVLITGSGPQNRDEELLGHKPFLVISDYLTKNGIAVLRYDDRGIGKSKGKFSTATTADFADDAEAAIAYLKTRTEINKQKIGLMGHSEGGTIAPMIAARNKDVNFIVMLAGSAIRGDKLLLLQKELIERVGGTSEAVIKKGQAVNKGAFDIILKSTNDETLKKDLTNYYTQILKDSANSTKPKDMSDEAFINAQVKDLTGAWWQYFIKYDPAIALQKVKCAVIAVNGEKDLQVPPKQNLQAIQVALKKAGNKNFTTKEFPGLNHLFQECKTGSPDEYAEIEQTFSPVVLDEITKWILSKVK
jgi:alpha/beta superfamily hydrolase